jgi:hypothetical protein
VEPPRALPNPSLPGVLRAPASALEALRANDRLLLIATLAGAGGASLVAWILILSGLEPRAITDIGLISIMPASAFVPMGLVALAFFVALRMRPLPVPLLAALIVTLIVMVYGAPAFVEEMPRFITAYMHIGFTDAITSTGELHPLRDARFDWPGFFVLFGFIRDAAGIDSSVEFLSWIPPISMLLYTLPLYVIYRSVTSDLRLVWLGIWVFVLANWVGQDYFSPQGFNFLLFLCIIAVLLYTFRARLDGSPGRLGRAWARLRERVWLPLPRTILVDEPAGPSRQLSRRAELGLVAVVGLLFGVSVVSHQLTPFAIFGAVVGLTMFRRLTFTPVTIAMFVLILSWLTFQATTYLSGHLAPLLDDVGDLGNVGGGLGDRVTGSPGHILVTQSRVAFAAAFWLLALIGGLRRIASGRLDLTLALLAAAPFGLVLLQGYGGEMLLRVYLFALPFMAFFAASAFLPTPRPASWPLTVGMVLMSVIVAASAIFVRYGNEKSDMVTAAEFEAMEVLRGWAQPGDTIAAANYSVPTAYIGWARNVTWNFRELFLEANTEGILEEMRSRTPPDRDVYVVISRGQAALAELFWGMSGEEWNARVADLQSRLETIYTNEDVLIMRLRPGMLAG